MITTTWTCDRCQKKQDTPEQMWKVGFKVASADNRHSAAVDAMPDIYSMANASLWCRDCIDSLELISRPKPKERDVEPPPEITFEEKLREIIRSEIEASRP